MVRATGIHCAPIVARGVIPSQKCVDARPSEAMGPKSCDAHKTSLRKFGRDRMALSVSIFPSLHTSAMQPRNEAPRATAVDSVRRKLRARTLGSNNTLLPGIPFTSAGISNAAELGGANDFEDPTHIPENEHACSHAFNVTAMLFRMVDDAGRDAAGESPYRSKPTTCSDTERISGCKNMLPQLAHKAAAAWTTFSDGRMLAAAVGVLSAVAGWRVSAT